MASKSITVTTVVKPMATAVSAAIMAEVYDCKGSARHYSAPMPLDAGLEKLNGVRGTVVQYTATKLPNGTKSGVLIVAAASKAQRIVHGPVRVNGSVLTAVDVYTSIVEKKGKPLAVRGLCVRPLYPDVPLPSTDVNVFVCMDGQRKVRSLTTVEFVQRYQIGLQLDNGQQLWPLTHDHMFWAQ